MSAKVIAVAAVKGGVGKTTTVVTLGQVLADRGERVAVVDLDPQASTREWAEGAAAAGRPLGVAVIPVYGHTRAGIPAALEHAAANYDRVVVDTSPSHLVDLWHALDWGVDAVIIPTKPMPDDYRQFISLRERIDPRLPVYGLLTQVRRGTLHYDRSRQLMLERDDEGRSFGLAATIPLREAEVAAVQLCGPPSPDATPDLYEAYEAALRELDRLLDRAGVR